jgi:Cd2+/Zn2+-exporting ATPase
MKSKIKEFISEETIKVFVALILFVIAIVAKFDNELINKGIFIVSYLIVGFEVLKEAIENIFKGKVLDENFLMAVATIGAFAINEFPEAVAVMLFYQIGELFQDYAVDKSKKSISSLMDIRPDFANVERNGILEKINPEEIKIGEEIIVKPGEKIPLDGIVVEGESLLDTVALTGESVPRKVAVGGEVLSGCINQNGLLKIKVTKEFGESTVSKILDLVENASNKKSKSENFISKFAKYYTPIVVIIAVILAVIPPLVIKDATFTQWLYRALSFLVVSCPCALVMSVPLSFFGGIGGASKSGILIKGSNYLEALSKTEIVVFDKTGTLTEGVFEVQKVSPVEISEEELIRITAYAENFSNHPIANSIKKAYNKEIDKNCVTDIQELSGRGIFAKVEGKEVLVGNEKLLAERKIEYVKCEEVGTILYVAIENKFAGFILIADKIKADSKKTISMLKANGIKRIVMLTGDRKNVAVDVCKKIGIDEVYSELLPDGKVEKVEELLSKKSKNGKLVFVGDGINDAPVLAMSDIGVAMGGLGADSAIEAADVVVMTDEPSKIGTAINISKKNMKIVSENIVFAITVKIAVLICSALGVSTMWEAVFADVGVSVIAIINALRMLKKRK